MKKRMMTTILSSLKPLIPQWKIMKKKVKNGHQMCPLMILVRSLLMHR
jgi:hypothetical protein